MEKRVLIVGPKMLNYIPKLAKYIREEDENITVDVVEYSEIKTELHLIFKFFLYPFWKFFSLYYLSRFFIDYNKTSVQIQKAFSENKTYDVVIGIKLYGVSIETLKHVIQGSSRFIYYRWDAKKRFPENPIIVGMTDHILSTCPTDDDSVYCPLPLLEELDVIGKVDCRYDYVHIGQFSYSRLFQILMFKLFNTSINIKIILANSPREMRFSDNFGLIAESLPWVDSKNYYSESRCIMDVLRPNQNFPSTRLELSKKMGIDYCYLGFRKIKLNNVTRISFFGKTQVHKKYDIIPIDLCKFIQEL